MLYLYYKNTPKIEINYVSYTKLANMTNKIITIQRAYRHHLEGKKHRQELKNKHIDILHDFKPFRISLMWDESDYYRYKSKSYRQFLELVVRCINVLYHPDEDDTESYMLTQEQSDLIQNTLYKDHIYRKDVNKIFRSLSVHQIMLIR